MLRMMNDPEASRDTNGSTSHRSPSPGPDEPATKATAASLPPDAAYAHESAHHYQEIQAAFQQHPHQQHHLPSLAMGFSQAPPPHLMYQQQAPPSRRSRQRATATGDAEGSDAGSGGPDDSEDEYVPERGGGGEGGTKSPSQPRRSRRDAGGSNSPDRDVLAPAHHPYAAPPLPPDDPYSQQQTLIASQSQSQGLDGGDDEGGEFMDMGGYDGGSGSTPKTKRGRKHQNDEEWNRLRKDNHKEVERRRRGNINEGISQLAAIVPNATGGEKAKGAILTRAVQYIHQLKDNEARNIEKWTLEKLLMDQAMGDLQAQLEDMKRRWEVEAQARMALEREMDMIKSGGETGSKRPRID